MSKGQIQKEDYKPAPVTQPKQDTLSPVDKGYDFVKTGETPQISNNHKG